jgi:hypothetical protein
MGNLNITKLGEAAQADHELPFEERLGRNVVEADPWYRPRALRGPEILALGLVSGAGWAGMLAILTLARLVLGWGGCYTAECSAALWLWWVWLASPAVVLPLGIGALVWGHVARVKAEAARVAVTRDRYGNPVSAESVLRQAPAEQWAALRLATEAEIAVAPHRVYRGVDALTVQHAAAQLAAAQQQAPAPAVIVESATEWLGWLSERPHLMLAAETGGGKSVLAGVVVAQRAAMRGDEVAILDPHWSPMVLADEGRLVPKWGGVPPAAQSHAEIRGALIKLRSLYDARLEALRAGEIIEGCFPWLTVVIDEVPEVVKALKGLDPRGVDTWGATTEVLGSGARKVNINVILLTQSPLVEDIGMNSAMRKNFYRIALATDECRRLISEEPDKPRRDALLEALRGRPFPAALERKGEVWVVNRTGLLDMLPERITAPAWQPSASAEAPQAPSEAPQRTDGRTDGATTPVDRVALLRALRRSGKSRDDARDLMRAYGIEFENALWTEAGEGL